MIQKKNEETTLCQTPFLWRRCVKDKNHNEQNTQRNKPTGEREREKKNK
jgi:hypothetical protein